MATEEASLSKDTRYQRALMVQVGIKAKFLFLFFLSIFLIEIGFLSLTDFPRVMLGKGVDVLSLIAFPIFLAIAALAEGGVWLYYRRKSRLVDPGSMGWAPYGIAFVECLFPSLVMYWMLPVLLQSPKVDLADLLDAPPVFFYFFFIILSALHLKPRLSWFAGLTSGLGYLFISHKFLPQGIEEDAFVHSMQWFKAILLLVGGFLAGGIAGLIHRMIASSLEAKDRFIHRLDEKVREQTRELRGKNELLEHRNREITDSIDYARRIQNALLQRKGGSGAELPQHFILFKPLSQVSGDFYWMWRTEGGIYLAAMDCTGHGVPGAFMSMLGISQLDEIMAKGGEPMPGELLSELRERVVRELGGSEEGDTAKDGMDGAVVKMPDPHDQDPNGTEVPIEFAGAQNPLYVVRKGIGEDPPSVGGLVVGNDHDRSVKDRLKPFKKSPDGIEIKGDPMPVGYHEHVQGDFTTVSLRLQKGDMLYFFSDGYADQFGGSKGKKFGYGRFKQLLTDIREKPLEEQKEILDRTFEDWKAESRQEQVDDVLVIGATV